MKNDLSERDDGRNSGVVRLEQSIEEFSGDGKYSFRDTRSRDILADCISELIFFS